MKMFQMLALGSVLAAGLVMAQAPTVPSTASGAATTAQKAMKPKTPPPTAAEIADAKSKGMVWVNTSTKKYHHADATQYGTTKNGKFMTEADAKAAGNVEAKDKKKTAAAATTPKS